MHRMKIGLIAAGLLLVFTAIFYVAATSAAKEAVSQDVEEKVARAQRVYQHISSLGALDVANLASARARKSTVIAIGDKTDETARQAAFEECEALNAGLAHEGRRADIVAILDANGKVLARDLNPNADYGEDVKSKFPAVAQALKGEAVKDIWNWQNRMMEVGLAPIAKPGGNVVGALIVGFVVSAKKAQERRDLMGADIVYFHNGRIVTSSFVSAGDASKEDVAKTQAAASLLFQGPNLAQEALQKNAPTPVQRAVIEGEQYAVLASPSPGNFADKTSGVLLLASLGDSVARARQPATTLALFGLLAIVVALGAAVFTAKRFIAPLDQIELGVAEVINGNIDYTFKPVGPDFEGLSNSLNVMLARLLGRDEPNEDAVDEEETEGTRWRADQMVIDEGTGRSVDVVGALAQEPEASYYPRLFNEYVNALRATGRPADGVSVQAFMAKLRLAEAGLRQKWSCRMVRFQLAPREDQLVFRAVRID